jgi:hypothetical protein
VIAGDGEHGRSERTKEPRRSFVLVAPPAICEVAGGDDHIWADTVDERSECVLHLRILACTDVEIGYMEEACRHNRMRL